MTEHERFYLVVVVNRFNRMMNRLYEDDIPFDRVLAERLLHSVNDHVHNVELIDEEGEMKMFVMRMEQMNNFKQIVDRYITSGTPNKKSHNWLSRSFGIR